jgi:hypothetical protein
MQRQPKPKPRYVLTLDGHDSFAVSNDADQQRAFFLLMKRRCGLTRKAVEGLLDDGKMLVFEGLIAHREDVWDRAWKDTAPGLSTDATPAPRTPALPRRSKSRGTPKVPTPKADIADGGTAH